MKFLIACIAIIALVPAVVPCKSGAMKSYVDKLQKDNPQKCMQCPELNITTLCEVTSGQKVDCGKATITYSLIKTPGLCGRAFVKCNAQKKRPTAIIAVEKDLFEKVPCSQEVIAPEELTSTSTSTTASTTTTTTTTTTTAAPTTVATTTTTETACNKYVPKSQLHYDVPKAAAKKPCKSALAGTTTTTTAEPCEDDIQTTIPPSQFIPIDDDAEVELEPTVEVLREKRAITDVKYQPYTFISKEAYAAESILTCNEYGQWEITNGDGELITGIQELTCLVGAVGL
uniref:C6 domain-containing protein n=1 Tax=Panagrellus redivivus TaxID=6233 RepID=A0A7E4WCH9_PANRE